MPTRQFCARQRGREFGWRTRHWHKWRRLSGQRQFRQSWDGVEDLNASTVGRIAGYNAGTLQWGADTDGKLKAGAGNVQLDANGIRILGDTVDYADPTAIELQHALTFRASSSDFGWLAGSVVSGNYQVILGTLPPGTTGSARLTLLAQPIELVAGAGTTLPKLELQGSDSVSSIVIAANDIGIGWGGFALADISISGAITINGGIVSDLSLGESSGPDSRLHIRGTNAQSGGITLTSTAGTAADRLAIYPSGNLSVALKALASGGEFHFMDYLGNTALRLVSTTRNLGVNGASLFGSGEGMIGIANRGVAPTTNPTGGGVLYAESGA